MDAQPLSHFPPNDWSDAVESGAAHPEKRGRHIAFLAEKFWKPVYWAFRIHGATGDPEARDRTRQFLARLIGGNIEEHHASFRSHVAATFHAFRLELPPYAGEGASLPLDFDTLDSQPPPAKSDPQQTLNLLWARQVLEDAVNELRFALAAADKSRDFEIFRAHDMMDDAQRPTIDALAAQNGISALSVQTTLTACRQKLRTALLKRISLYVKNVDALFGELRVLFGE